MVRPGGVGGRGGGRSGRIGVERSGLAYTIVIGPERSWWTMLVTPMVLVLMVYEVVGAAGRVAYVGVFLVAGTLLGLFYAWWFCWNVFGRQEVTFREGDMTIANRLLGMGLKRAIGLEDIAAIRYQAGGFRGSSALLVERKDRKASTSFAANLDRADSLAVLGKIAEEVPMLASRVKVPEY